jgi:prevent-host-death family protein
MTTPAERRPERVATASELRDRQTDVLDSVFRGEHVLITRDGRPRAVMVPLEFWQQATAPAAITAAEVDDWHEQDEATQ